MRRSQLLLAQLALVVALAVGSTCFAFAQSGSPVATGDTHLVVSRSSDPAPVAWASTTWSFDAARHWAAVALANTRAWVLSFAPARVAVNSRRVAVSRRATP
jgi:hypothetical protein